jgi:uncharacterized peroxidase-related enzyme
MSTARVEPIQDHEASEDVELVFEGARQLLGRVPNFIRTVAHSPAEGRWLLPFLATTQREGVETVLDGRLRELAIVRTSQLNGCNYCATHNRSLGLATGLTEGQLDVLDEDYWDSGRFTERELLAIEWAEHVTLNTAKQATDLYGRMQDAFTSQEIVELTLVTAMFNMVNRVNESLHVELEDQATVDRIKRSVHVDPAVLHDYVERALEAHAPALQR